MVRHDKFLEIRIISTDEAVASMMKMRFVDKDIAVDIIWIKKNDVFQLFSRIGLEDKNI